MAANNFAALLQYRIKLAYSEISIERIAFSVERIVQINKLKT